MKNGRRADSVALPTLSFSESLKQHWPEYLMEAAALGIFMISAGVFTALFECPGSFVHQAITHEEVRRAMIGVAMGATANWTATWIYFTASPVGMLLAAQGYLLVKDPESIRCCKLHHRSDRRCIFCGRRTLPEGSGTDNLSLGAR
jgi:hypothetical protein